MSHPDLIERSGLGSLIGWGGGDQQQIFQPTIGQRIDIRLGTAAAPDTNLNPGVKVTRTQMITPGSVHGTGAEQLAAIMGISVGIDPGGYQPVGIYGAGKQSSLQTFQGATVAAVVAGGAGYAVGDVLDVDGGTASIPTQLLVTAVAAGVVTGVSIIEEGAYSATPANPVTTTRENGAGAGATFTMTWSGIGTVDAMGVHGSGIALANNSSTTVYGGYMMCRRNKDAGGALITLAALTCMEFQCQNLSVTDSYLANGGHLTKGIRIHAKGFQCACAIDAKRTNGAVQWDVFLGFPQGSNGSPVAQACIRADCTAPYMLRIESLGSAAFTTGAIAVADGNNAGVVGNAVMIGQTAARASDQSNAYLVVASSNSSTADPMIWLGSTSASMAHMITFRNQVGRLQWAVAGSSGNFFTGAAAGDFAWKHLDSGKVLLFGGAHANAGASAWVLKIANGTSTPTSGGVTVCQTAGMTLGFFRSTAGVTQRTGWGTATGTATRTTFDTATVTLSQLAERVKALIDDLHATAGYGLIAT